MLKLRTLIPMTAALPLAWVAIPPAPAVAQAAAPWLKNYESNAESRKYPSGSAAERRARMHGIAYSRAYTRAFDLSDLPDRKSTRLNSSHH